MEQQLITCKNCGNQYIGKFCNKCGEKIYREVDKSFLTFWDDALHFITHFDGKLFTSLSTMFRSPGKLSEDYCNGIRVKYFKPLPLFLMIVILYLFFPVFEGLNMQLKFFPKQPYYGAYAAEKISKTQNTTGLSFEELSAKFHQKGEKVSKIMLLSIIPFTALFFWAVGFRKRKFLFDHLVFSAELNAFFLLWGFLILPLLFATIFLVFKFFTSAKLYVPDEGITIAIYVILIGYLSKAMRRFYHFKWWVHLLVLILFYFVHSFIVYSLYKFLLFVITIYQIH